jgi:hypothetical protein
MGFWIGGTLGWLGFWPWDPPIHAVGQAAITACGVGSLIAVYWPSDPAENELKQLGYIKDGSQKEDSDG